MFSLWGFWFRRDTVPRSPRRFSPPLGLEPLEDRLAPTNGMAFSILLVGEARTTGQPLSAMLTRQAPVASRFDLLREEARRAEGVHHPLLAALAIHAGGLSLGNGLLFSSLNDPPASPLAPVVPLGTPLTSMALTPAADKPPSPPMPFSASAFAVSSQGTVANLPKLPAPDAALGFPNFNPSAPKPAKKDRPSNFALSPFDPSGLDIVPVPEPRGLEEKLADLLGDPSPSPQDASRNGALGAANDRDQAAIRDAVQQMLQEGGTFSLAQPQQAETLAPFSAAESSPPNTATDDIFSAGTPLDPSSDDAAEGTGVVSVACSVLAFLAGGADFAGRVLRRSPKKDKRRPLVKSCGKITRSEPAA